MKKTVQLRGVIGLPLTIGGYAYIQLGDQTLRTSPLVSILEVSTQKVVIETQNSIYSVSPSFQQVLADDAVQSCG